MNMVDETQHIKALQILYDHAQALRNEQVQFYSLKFDKIHKLLTLYTVLFGGLSFALSLADFSTIGGVVRLGIATLGIATAIPLCCGFYVLLSLFKVAPVWVSGIDKLFRTVKSQSPRASTKTSDRIKAALVGAAVTAGITVGGSYVNTQKNLDAQVFEVRTNREAAVQAGRSAKL